MAKRILPIVLAAACIMLVSPQPAAAQQMIYYRGDCADYKRVWSPDQASCSTAAIHLMGTSWPWRRFVFTLIWGATDVFACPDGNFAEHQAAAWHPPSGVQRLNALAYLDGIGGPIKRRTGTITVNANLSSTSTPYQPQNCYVH